MRRFVQKYKWPLLGVALAVVLALCAWTFGWFGGTINVMDFTAEEVERIELYHYWLSDQRVAVTEKVDIQALIDEINGFRNTGTMLKHPKKLIPGGGELWYDITVRFADGDSRNFCFIHIGKRSVQADADWRYDRFSTCRGSMKLFCELHEKYSTDNPA